MIVDGYVRVSRVDRRKRGKRRSEAAGFISPAVQRERIETWAKRNDALVAQVFEELVAEPARPQRRAPGDRPLARDRPVRPSPVELPLGDREHHPQHQPPRVGRKVKPPMIDRDKRAARIRDPLNSVQPIPQRTAKTAQVGDHDPLRVAALDPADRLHQQRPIAAPTRLIAVVMAAVTWSIRTRHRWCGRCSGAAPRARGSATCTLSGRFGCADGARSSGLDRRHAALAAQLAGLPGRATSRRALEPGGSRAADRPGNLAASAARDQEVAAAAEPRPALCCGESCAVPAAGG
jgi:hypothetical protein